MLKYSRTFRLREGGVECSAEGLTVAGFSLLVKVGDTAWKIRAPDETEKGLSKIYCAPIKLSQKLAGLEVVAQALTKGHTALAQIATLLLKIPDPEDISLGPSATSDNLANLFAAGWLEKDWAASKHPRTGTAPNPGWFAPVDDGGTDTESRASSAKPNESFSQYALTGDRNDCFRICSDLALPTSDFGISFRRCILACTSNGNSGFPE